VQIFQLGTVFFSLTPFYIFIAFLFSSRNLFLQERFFAKCLATKMHWFTAIPISIKLRQAN
jgi:hypothetical protein